MHAHFSSKGMAPLKQLPKRLDSIHGCWQPVPARRDDGSQWFACDQVRSKAHGIRTLNGARHARCVARRGLIARCPAPGSPRAELLAERTSNRSAGFRGPDRVWRTAWGGLRYQCTVDRTVGIPTVIQANGRRVPASHRCSPCRRGMTRHGLLPNASLEQGTSCSAGGAAAPPTEFRPWPPLPFEFRTRRIRPR